MNVKELNAVRRKFWPRIDAQGKRVEPDSMDCLVRHHHGNPTAGEVKAGLLECELSPSGGYSPEKQKLKIDPDVVWVGSFMAGLVHFGVFPDEHTAGAFMFDAADAHIRKNEKGIANNRFVLPNRLGIERIAGKLVGEWPYNGSKYAERLYLHRLSGSGLEGAQNPGDVLNSPRRRTDEVDIWQQTTSITYDPIINLDTRFKLHILNRGDRITRITKGGEANTSRTDIWVLRPAAEGSSRVPVVDGEQARVV